MNQNHFGRSPLQWRKGTRVAKGLSLAFSLALSAAFSLKMAGCGKKQEFKAHEETVTPQPQPDPPAQQPANQQPIFGNLPKNDKPLESPEDDFAVNIQTTEQIDLSKIKTTQVPKIEWKHILTPRDSTCPVMVKGHCLLPQVVYRWTKAADGDVEDTVFSQVEQGCEPSASEDEDLCAWMQDHAQSFHSSQLAFYTVQFNEQVAHDLRRIRICHNSLRSTQDEVQVTEFRSCLSFGEEIWGLKEPIEGVTTPLYKWTKTGKNDLLILSGDASDAPAGYSQPELIFHVIKAAE